ncbi:MAG: toxin-antitoxin system protein [Candidatus Omnitrophica bacterium]|nr:hypothetical protein [bacterium]NUN96856.1 toxin-antitoxin system protein [Candidatus Omnitrophota bacterium]
MTTIPISPSTEETLKRLSALRHEPVEAVLAEAVEEFHKKCLIAETNDAYRRLKEDPEARGEWEEEMALWDTTLMDGLDPNETWNELPVRKGPNA